MLNQAGTAFLTEVPGWTVWALLLLALYVLPRVGRIVDSLLHRGWRLLRNQEEPVQVRATSVDVEAGSESEAVAAGMLALAGNAEGKVDTRSCESRNAT